MTTREFIELLQKEDPSGESHIRMPGGVPVFVQRKPGYYDGPYDYINKDGKWVVSSLDSKVDVYCKEPEDIVSDVFDEWNSYGKEGGEGLWEKVQSMFIFETSYVNQKHTVDPFMERVKKFYDEWLKFKMESDEQDLVKVIDLNKRGCRFFRLKNTNNKWYSGWKFVNDKNPEDIGHPNLEHTYPILVSGRFKETDHDDDYFEYILI